jgi:hypothetical protein
MTSLRQLGMGLLLLAVSLGVVLLGLLAALGDAAAFEAGLEASCPPPKDWVLQDIAASNGTLEAVATRYNVTVEQIREANCLPSALGIPAGRPLYLPPPPQGDI